MNRRTFLATGIVAIAGCKGRQPPRNPLIVNDIHSRLNPTPVAQIISPSSAELLRNSVIEARKRRQPVCIAGGRHAMGGQQFAHGATLIDTRNLNRVLGLDRQNGVVEVEAGIQWPGLIDQLIEMQRGDGRQWGIRQKQTGADRLCIGGALGSNIHGRGLVMKPIIDDVESFVLLDSEGKLQECSRTRNPELFRLAIGGYGLFGVIYSVKLRLSPRRKVQRTVEIMDIEQLIPGLESRVRDGYLYGDFQFSIDELSPHYLRRGVFSCYRPVPDETPMEEPKRASETDWLKLVAFAHKDKARVYEIYTKAYLSTNGKIYWSDTHQLGTYVDDYHLEVDKAFGAKYRATEIITEIYVPRARLVDLMSDIRADFRRNNVNLIYGTIRLIERDDESFLPWAKDQYACVVFNLHTIHTAGGRAHSAEAFRRLIDAAARREGSFYLTYHRYATREQIEKCYPGFREFLSKKKELDPEERFQSEWYRHHKKMFGAA